MKVIEVLAEAGYNPNVVGSGIVVDPNYKEKPGLKSVTPGKPITPEPTTPLATAKPAPTITKPAPTPNVKAPPSFNPGQFVELLTKVAKQKGLSAASDLANFLGQCKVETSNWASAVENFNYTDPNRIYKVFTSNFPTPQHAAPYVGNQVALANRALANKNGNGDEKSGDGWKYRGRGFIHLTGRELYAKAGAGVHPENPDIYIDNPDLLSTNPKEAALASVWYYRTKVGKGKTSKQATKVVNPAGLKTAERQKAAKQQLAQIQRSGSAAQPRKKS